MTAKGFPFRTKVSGLRRTLGKNTASSSGNSGAIFLALATLAGIIRHYSRFSAVCQIRRRGGKRRIIQTMADSNYLSEMFGLRGSIAAVTGGGSGIGRQIGKALAAAGAQTVLIGRRENLLQEAADEINAAAKEMRAAVFAADLSETENLPQIAEKISACFGAPRIVVNAAGVNLRSSSEPARSAADITPESWRNTFRINLEAPFFLTRALVGGMKNGGAVINIGSMQSMRAGLGDAAYGASKGGIAQLTRACARAWGEKGVTVNGLLPGFFPSEMTDMVFSDAELAAKLAGSTILGRNGKLADMEGAAVFLASPAAAYITGVLLPVDGGFLAK